MPKQVTIQVETDRKYLLVLHKVEKKAAEEEPFAGLLTNIVNRKQPLWQESQWRFEHLGAALLESPRTGTIDPEHDLWNVLVSLSFESGPFPSESEIIFANEDLRSRAERPVPPQEYLYSGRKLPGRGMILGAVDIISGYNAQLTLRRLRPPTEPLEAPRPFRTYGLQHNADYVGKMRTPAEQLADWDQLEPLFQEQADAGFDSGAMDRFKRGRERVQAMGYEKFEPFTGRFTQADMVLRALGLAPGLYVPSFTAGDQFYGWDTEDTSQYRTIHHNIRNEVVVGPALVVTGRRGGTRVLAHLAPRRHQILFAWTAVYAVATIFTSPVLITEVNIGTYSDILPLDWAYIGAEDDFRNSSSMSRRIEGSKRYGVAKAQDFGSQVFSPYFIKVLVGRDDGQWAVREGDRQVGDLCAILDCENGGYDPDYPELGGGNTKYEITRLTAIPGGRRMNYGFLQTGDVRPYDPSGQSIWTISLPFGNL